MSKTEFDVFCPGCNMLVAAKVVAEGNGGFRSDAVSPLDEVDAEYHGEHYYVTTSVCAVGAANRSSSANRFTGFQQNSKPSQTRRFFIRTRRSYRLMAFPTQ